MYSISIWYKSTLHTFYILCKNFFSSIFNWAFLCLHYCCLIRSKNAKIVFADDAYCICSHCLAYLWQDEHRQHFILVFSSSFCNNFFFFSSFIFYQSIKRNDSHWIGREQTDEQWKGNENMAEIKPHRRRTHEIHYHKWMRSKEHQR